MFEKIRSIGLYIIYIGIFLFVFTKIADYISARNKKNDIVFSHYLNVCKQNYDNLNIQINSYYGNDQFSFTTQSDTTQLNTLVDTIDNTLFFDTNSTEMGILFYVFLTGYNDQYIKLNFDVLSSILVHFEYSLREINYIDFLDDLKKISENNNNKNFSILIELIKSNLYFKKLKHKKALEIISQNNDIYAQLYPKQESQIESLWQLGMFSELESVLSDTSIDNSLKEEYYLKLSKLSNANSTNTVQKINLYQYIKIALVILIILALTIKSLIDIISYFKIFFFYKAKQLKGNLLYSKITKQKKVDCLVCPVCSNTQENAKIINHQSYHKEFYICEEHGEIMIPLNSCSNCGAELDKNMNCPVCDFNEKGELNFIFLFDLLTSILFLILLGLLFTLTLYEFFCDSFNINYFIVKVGMKAVYLINIIFALIPFIIRDLKIKSLQRYFSFERYFIVSLDKFTNLLVLFFVIILLLPTNSIFLTQSYITFFDFIEILIVTYGIFKFLIFGQEHSGFYHNHIKLFFNNGIFIIMILFVISIVPDFPYLLKHISQFYSNIFVVLILNKIFFVFLVLIIFLNKLGYKNKKSSYNEIIYFLNTNYLFFFSVFFVILCATFIYIIYWFLVKHFVPLQPLLIELLYLGAYYFIIAKHDNSSSLISSNKIRLSYLINLQLILFSIFYFTVNSANSFNTIYSNTNISHLKGLLSAVLLISKNQINRLISMDIGSNVPVFTFCLILVMILLIISLLVFNKIKSIFRYVKPKRFVNLEEAARLRLTLKHFEKLGVKLNSLINEKNIIRSEIINKLVYEQKYLLKPLVNDLKSISLIGNNLILTNDNRDLKNSLERYQIELKKIKENIHIPSIYEDIDISQIENTTNVTRNFRFVIIWEDELRKLVFKSQNEYLQLTEEIWSKSIKLYYNALTRFYDQINYIYSTQFGNQVYSISEINYFTLVFSNKAYFPPSVEKIFAMRLNKRTINDFVYIYFCDNFPHVKTSTYMKRNEDIHVRKNLDNIQQLAQYKTSVRELQQEFETFKSELQKYGYKSEYYELNTTIKINKGYRTLYNDSEKPNAAQKLIKINNDEFYQAKFALVVEKAKFKNISGLEDREKDQIRLFI